MAVLHDRTWAGDGWRACRRLPVSGHNLGGGVFAALNNGIG